MNLQPLNNQTSVDPVQLAKRVLKKWYIILICVILFSVIAYFHNKYSIPKYQVKAVIEVNKNQSADPLGLIFSQNNRLASNFTDEIVKLKSIPILLSTIKDLDFAVNYYDENPLQLIELYKDSPIRLNIDANSTNIPYGKQWICKFIDEKNFRLNTGEKEKVFEFGEKAKINDFVFSIDLIKPEDINNYNHIIFKINKLYDIIREYQGKLNLHTLYDNSSLLQISILGTNTNKEMDFINKYIQEVIRFDVNQKRAFSEKSIEFIDNQLAENSDSLQLIEGAIKKFKYQQVPVDPSLESNQLYSNIKQLEQEKANILLSNQYYNYLLESFDESRNVEEIVVPSSMGIQDNILNQLISRLVSLQLDVKLLMSDNKSKNPLLHEKQQVIKELKSNIISNVKNSKATNEIRMKD